MARQGQRIDDETRERIRAALAAGNTVTYVAKQFDVSRATVRAIRDEVDAREFTELRHKKKTEYIEKAWEVINAYMEHLAKPETIQKASAHAAAVVVGVMWDRLLRIQELALREQELELKIREMERKENGLSDESVQEIIGRFARALGTDTVDWESEEEKTH